MTEEVRAATSADHAATAQTLARAFHDDPMICHLLRDEASRPQKMPRLFVLLLKLGQPLGGCDVTSGLEAAAIWRPPGHWHTPLWQYIVHLRDVHGIFGFRGFEVMQSMDIIEKVHPKAPHWYLQVIGTDPAAQGKGFGGRLMRRGLAVVDEAHAPAYLESSKEANIPIYQSFGFAVTGEIRIKDGPTVYAMWREPRV
ncbi:MAG: GNAT family N-acetyltransferase [Pseudomonadota bacterium]|nr:GNAT family N-acetyltransferase [Pseudomonadota bacterium]